MESALNSLSLLHKAQVCSASHLLFHYYYKPTSTSSSLDLTSLLSQRHFPKCSLSLSHSQNPLFGSKAKENQILGLRALHASDSDSINPTSTDVSEKWLLEPIGDGDSRHIGFKVEMPGAYEIASSEVTVGRVPDKANLVIPVATVSAMHARIQKKQGNLLVTDLDSTNGTFIDDKRLRPGVVATVSSGSCIIFGDIHLAMFRVSKVEEVAAKDNTEETKPEQEDTENTQTS